jgi:hypothetical protein
MKPPFPKNEAQRLKVLWQYEVLDTVPEEVFDDLTELAALICEAPVALISLVDEKRQWFKSRVGISAKQTDRNVSFCAHAILQNGLFIVADATQDPRFKANPLVTGSQKVRFYAGVPLKSPDGYALGTLCVLDRKPRHLRPGQKRALRLLARHVETQLEVRRHARELADARAHGDRHRAELARAHVEIVKLRRQVAHFEAKPKSSRSARQ